MMCDFPRGFFELGSENLVQTYYGSQERRKKKLENYKTAVDMTKIGKRRKKMAASISLIQVHRGICHI